MVVLLNVSSQRFEGNLTAKIYEWMSELIKKVQLKNYAITIKSNQQHRTNRKIQTTATFSNMIEGTNTKLKN